MIKDTWLRLIRWTSKRLPLRNIPRDDGPYLERYHISGRWRDEENKDWDGRSYYLHRFHRADLEPPGVLHTHPWKWSCSLVLSGGYTEERLIVRDGNDHTWKLRKVRSFTINFFRTGAAHRIAELHGEVWTLFVTGPKASSWGFLIPGKGYIDEKDYF